MNPDNYTGKAKLFAEALNHENDLKAENAALRSQLEEAQAQHEASVIAAGLIVRNFERELAEATIPEGKIDAEIVGPIVRKIYGDSAELGHYKLAIEAFKQGREGTLVVLGQLGRAKLRAEAAERELATAQARIAKLNELVPFIQLWNDMRAVKFDSQDRTVLRLSKSRWQEVTKLCRALAEPQSGEK